MKDKFKDTKGLDKAYMSLAKHYDERKENAIRQIKDGAFVDLLNQEMEELQNSMKDKEKQIEELAKVINENCFIDKTYYGDEWFADDNVKLAECLYDNGYRKIDKDSVVISKEEYYELKQAKTLLEISKEEINNLADANIRYGIALENKGKETAEKILTKLQPYIGGWVLFKELEKEYGIEVEIKE